MGCTTSRNETQEQYNQCRIEPEEEQYNQCRIEPEELQSCTPLQLIQRWPHEARARALRKDLRKLAREGPLDEILAMAKGYTKYIYLEEILERRFGTFFDLLAENERWDVFGELFERFFGEGTDSYEKIFLTILSRCGEMRNFYPMAKLCENSDFLARRLCLLLEDIPKIFEEKLKGDHPSPGDYDCRATEYDHYVELLYAFNRRGDWEITKRKPSHRAMSFPDNREKCLKRARNLVPYYQGLFRQARASRVNTLG